MKREELSTSRFETR